MVQAAKKAWTISRRNQQQIQGSVGTPGDIEEKGLSPRRNLLGIATKNLSGAQRAHQANSLNSGVNKKQNRAD